MWNRLLSLKAQLLGHQGVRRYGANTAWLMGEKVLRMFMGLFVGIWVARYLGPEQFGLLSYAQSFVFLFTAIATLGLDSIVVRELVKDNSQRNILLGTAFTFKLIGSLCILPLLWLGVQFTSNDSYTNLLIFSIASGTIVQSFNVIDFYYQSSVLSKYVAFANTITLAISSIVKIILILNEASLLTFAIVGAFDTVILSLGLIYFYRQKTHQSLREWQFDRVVAKRLLSDSWPLILSSVMISISMRVDQVMIKNMLSDTELGYYAAAVRVSEAWFFIPAIICGSIYPSIINSYKNSSKDSFNRRKMILYTSLTLVGIIVSAFVTIFSDFIILSLFGSNYLSSIEVLKIVVWVGVIVCFGSAWSLVQIIMNRQKFMMFFEIMSVSLNVIFNYFLIKRYGLNGAAFSTILSVLIAYFLYYILVKGRDEKTFSFYN